MTACVFVCVDELQPPRCVQHRVTLLKGIKRARLSYTVRDSPVQCVRIECADNATGRVECEVLPAVIMTLVGLVRQLPSANYQSCAFNQHPLITVRDLFVQKRTLLEMIDARDTPSRTEERDKPYVDIYLTLTAEFHSNKITKMLRSSMQGGCSDVFEFI